MTEVEYIKAQLAETERLLGLTEEALELALAALKLHRVIDGQNPTPVTYDQAISNLLEEYGDVTNCIEVLITPSQNKDAMQSRFEKAEPLGSSIGVHAVSRVEMFVWMDVAEGRELWLSRSLSVLR